MASHKVKTLNDLNFDAAISAATGPVLVDFTATWCGPCKIQSTILDRIADESDGVLVAAVDVDECPALAARFGVRGMPTLLVFRGGKEAGRRLGLANEAATRTLLGGGAPGAQPSPGRVEL